MSNNNSSVMSLNSFTAEEIRVLKQLLNRLPSDTISSNNTEEQLTSDLSHDSMDQDSQLSPSSSSEYWSRPSSNTEYRNRLRHLRNGYRRQLRDLKREYGVAKRYRSNFTKVKK